MKNTGGVPPQSLERREPDSEPKMRYFKIPLCRNFVWKVRDYSRSDDMCQWCRKSKIEIWHVSYRMHGSICSLWCFYFWVIVTDVCDQTW